MAILFADSFDFYNANNDFFAGIWDSANLQTSATSRFSVGKSMVIGTNGLTGTKVLPRSQTTIWVTFSFIFNQALSGSAVTSGFALQDGSTNQVGIYSRSDGAIVVTTGTSAGAVLATYAGAFLGAQWNHFQIKVVINNTTGTVTIRKNGNPADDFASGSINTRNGTANFTANKIVVTATPTTVSAFMDDLLIFDDTGAGPLNTWCGDVRSIQIMPLADTAQKQFTLGGLSNPTLGNTTVTTSMNAATGTGYGSPQFTATQQQIGTLASITVEFNAAFAGHAKCALYTVSGTTATLLATTNEVTAPGLGVNTFTFASPPQIKRGIIYQLYVTTDALASLRAQGNQTLNSFAVTYAAGFPASSAITSTATTTRPTIYTLLTLYNAAGVSELIEDGDTSYVQDATPGDFDLYTCDQLATTPAAIYAVVAKEFIKKTDANFRAGAMVVVSGITTDVVPNAAPGLNLATTYQWNWKMYEQDPNTTAQWGAGAVNALEIGPKTIS